MWRDGRQRLLKPIDALKIYALNTAPAFEAALLTGLRLAGPLDDYKKPIKQFARHLGVGFQILNDLKDWTDDADNKLTAGTDILGKRPTVLWALALESLSESAQQNILALFDQDPPTETLVTRVSELYLAADVFQKAAQLVDKYQQRAEEIADKIEPESLRRLLYYLIDTVLYRGNSNLPELPVVQISANATSQV